MPYKIPSFDQMLEWAKNQPEKLEAYRQREINAIIEQAPSDYQRRLKGLQFQIDARRATHKSALGSCIEISKMMHDSLRQLQHIIENDSAGNEDQKASNSAQILPFNVAG